MPARSQTRRVARRTRTGTWVTTTTIGTADNAPADADPSPHDLTAALETAIGRDIVGATFVRAIGEIQLVVTPSAAAPTFTRALLAFGIMWGSEDHITDASPTATVPNPFDDDYPWLWRRFRNVNFAAQATTAGAGTDRYNSYIPIVLRRRAKQPSPKHKLWLIGALNSAGQGNLTSGVNFSYMVNCGFAVG